MTYTFEIEMLLENKIWIDGFGHLKENFYWKSYLEHHEAISAPDLPTLKIHLVFSTGSERIFKNIIMDIIYALIHSRKNKEAKSLKTVYREHCLGRCERPRGFETETIKALITYDK